MSGPSPNLLSPRNTSGSSISDEVASPRSARSSRSYPSHSSIATPRSGVTFGPSVTSASPCLAARKKTGTTHNEKDRTPLPQADLAKTHETVLPDAPSLKSASAESPEARIYIADTRRTRQAHLVKLHPPNASLADQPCQGKRIKTCKLLLCDSLYQNGITMAPVRSSPAES